MCFANICGLEERDRAKLEKGLALTDLQSSQSFQNLVIFFSRATPHRCLIGSYIRRSCLENLSAHSSRGRGLNVEERSLGAARRVAMYSGFQQLAHELAAIYEKTSRIVSGYSTSFIKLLHIGHHHHEEGASLINVGFLREWFSGLLPQE